MFRCKPQMRSSIKGMPSCNHLGYTSVEHNTSVTDQDIWYTRQRCTQYQRVLMSACLNMQVGRQRSSTVLRLLWRGSGWTGCLRW